MSPEGDKRKDRLAAWVSLTRIAKEPIRSQILSSLAKALKGFQTPILLLGHNGRKQHLGTQFRQMGVFWRGDKLGPICCSLPNKREQPLSILASMS